jgi:hypothetical protein
MTDEPKYLTRCGSIENGIAFLMRKYAFCLNFLLLLCTADYLVKEETEIFRFDERCNAMA